MDVVIFGVFAIDASTLGRKPKAVDVCKSPGAPLWDYTTLDHRCEVVHARNVASDL